MSKSLSDFLLSLATRKVDICHLISLKLWLYLNGTKRSLFAQLQQEIADLLIAALLLNLLFLF